MPAARSRLRNHSSWASDTKHESLVFGLPSLAVTQGWVSISVQHFSQVLAVGSSPPLWLSRGRVFLSIVHKAMAWLRHSIVASQGSALLPCIWPPDTVIHDGPSMTLPVLGLPMY